MPDFARDLEILAAATPPGPCEIGGRRGTAFRALCVNDPQSAFDGVHPDAQLTSRIGPLRRDDQTTADASTAHEGDLLDPQEAAYRALHGERERLERDLVLAQQHQQFSSDDEAIVAARQREVSLLQALDRVMTQIRAAEIRRKPGSPARRWQ